MNYIAITDISGNNIDNDKDINSKLPFILVHTTQPYLLLEKVSSVPEIDGIWKLVLPTIFHILYVNKINPNNFAPVGDIWLPSPTLPKQLSILLVNTDIDVSKYPIDYVKLDSYTNFNIWKPICPRGYQEIGLIASPTKPSLRAIKVINNKYLLEYMGKSNVKGRNTNMNEFNLLSNIEIKKYTVNKTKLSNKNTVSNNNDNVALEDTITNDKTQSWKTHEGKRVMLVEPDIPWYITKKTAFPPGGYDIQSQGKLNEKEYRDNADFNSTFVMDGTRPDMGYGYSYAQRKGKDRACFDDCNKTMKSVPVYENFETSNDKKQKRIDFNVIACSLLLLIFLLVVVRYYINKN